MQTLVRELPTKLSALDARREKLVLLCAEDKKHLDEIVTLAFTTRSDASRQLIMAKVEVNSPLLRTGSGNFDAMRNKYISARSRAANTAQQAVDVVQEYELLVEQTPGQVENVLAAVAQAYQRVSSVRSKGYCTTSIDTMLTQANDLASTAQAELEKWHYRIAGTAASQAQPLAEQAGTYAQQLPQMKEQLPQLVIDAAKMGNDARTYIDEHREKVEFDELEHRLSQAKQQLNLALVEQKKPVIDYLAATLLINESLKLSGTAHSEAHKQVDAYLKLLRELERTVNKAKEAIKLVEQQTTNVNRTGNVAATRVKLADAQTLLHQAADESCPLKERYQLAKQAYDTAYDAATTLGRTRRVNDSSDGGTSAGFVFVGASCGGGR